MKGVVAENPEGVSYQSLGGAIVPFDLATGAITGDPVTTGASRAADEKSQALADVLHARPVVRREAANAQPAAPVAQRSAPIGPRDVVRAAKARIKEIKSELRNHGALKRELAELERLVQAAKKPVASVRELRRSG